mgnify:CR=1 FL=1
MLVFFFFKILLFTNLFVENLVNFGTFMNVTFNILKIIQDSTSKVLRNDWQILKVLRCVTLLSPFWGFCVPYECACDDFCNFHKISQDSFFKGSALGNTWWSILRVLHDVRKKKKKSRLHFKGSAYLLFNTRFCYFCVTLVNFEGFAHRMHAFWGPELLVNLVWLYISSFGKNTGAFGCGLALKKIGRHFLS